MDLLRLYRECLQRAVKGTRKSPWTLALPVVYLGILIVAGILVAPLGIIGSFAVGIIADLCTSSFLYFIAQTVLGSPSRASELKRSFVAYFWPVVSFGFVVWFVLRILHYALVANPNGLVIELGIGAVGVVLLNAVPEVIYQKGDVSGLAIIAASVRFIQAHWIEWFIPNLILGAIMYGVAVALSMIPLGLLLVPFVGGALVYFAMTFRGHLFNELETTSAFQRRLRYRSR